MNDGGEYRVWAKGDRLIANAFWRDGGISRPSAEH